MHELGVEAAVPDGSVEISAGLAVQRGQPAVRCNQFRYSFCLLVKVTVPTVTLGCGVASPTLMTFGFFSRKSFASISSWLAYPANAS